MTPAARERAIVRTPILLASAGAWILIGVLPECGMGHCHGQVATFLPDRLAVWAQGWGLMLVAMMSPLLVQPIRHVSDRSFAHRRVRATALFLAGYAAVWMAAGAVLLVLSSALAGLVGRPWILLVTGLAVTVWQASPLKQRCLNQLHQHPELPAFGARADAGALRFGLDHGLWCTGSCWGLMVLPMLLPGGHLVAMMAASLWVWGEQLGRPAVPAWSVRTPTNAVSLAVARVRALASRG